MLTAFGDFGFAALVMLGWVVIAFTLLFIGVFVMNLIGDWVYGRQPKDKRRGRGC